MKCPKTLITDSERPALPFEKCLAKTWNDGSILCGRTVQEHCMIAGSIAEILVSIFNNLVLNLLPTESFIPALLHDIGKICPTFQAKLWIAIIGRDNVRKEKPELAGIDPKVETSWNGHATVSGSALKEMGAPESLVQITGSHHGRFSGLRPASEFGGKSWQVEREKLVHLLMDGLPHVRGGVSQKYIEVLMAKPSSPRAWGCFLMTILVVAMTVVFPTCVGVFPW